MNFTLKQKIIGLAVLAALLPVIVIVALTAFQKLTASQRVQAELDILARDNVAQIAGDVYHMLEASNDLLQARVNSNLNVARDLVRREGGITMDSRTVHWIASNQVNGHQIEIELPRLMLGERWFGQIADSGQVAPLVDDIRHVTGGLLTVFQRMNDRGDMLRVASNITNEVGDRVIGTYIPATDGSGEPNPVISEVLQGRTFRGRAFVVGEWYLTAYEPIFDRGGGRVIGILSAAVRQEEVASIRRSIMDIVVGRTGYVYVLGGEGGHRGHYIISKDGARDGEDIWGARDSHGRLFIQDIVNNALSHEPGEITYDRYPWLNEGDREPRYKIVAVTYFEPWDWVIGAGTYEDDYYTARDRVNAALDALLVASIIGGVLILLLAVAGALVVGGRIVKPIIQIRDVAREISRGDLNTEIDITVRDEVGQLADAFREMSVSLRSKAGAAESIARGDMDAAIDIASESDVLGNAMARMKDRIEALLDETGGLILAIQEGNLARRGDITQFEGGWSSLVQGINELIDSFVNPFRLTSEYIDRISKGDIPEKITGEYRGDFNTIKNNLNTCIDAVDALVEDTQHMVKAALEGRLDTRADAGRHGGDFGEIVKGINDTLDAIIEPVKEASSCLAKMADGDLSVRVTGDYKGDHAIMKQSLNKTLKALNELLVQVAEAADQVNSGAQQVSTASQDLSQGATEQASSLEEISSSMTEIGSQTRLNADNANQTNELALTAHKSAETGNGMMQQMMQAMEAINESSAQVTKIIKVIDEIAFQTNLLALNAAVEAARAGVHGKGFAVVAEEVRNLAQRSAKAANETTGLIQGSIDRVNHGNNIAESTAASLVEIVSGVNKVTDLVNEIATASREQATGIDQITDALGQIDQVTQANTANAEQSAAAAEELSSQAAQLKKMLERFTLSESTSDVQPRRAVRGERRRVPEIIPDEMIADDGETESHIYYTAAGKPERHRMKGEVTPDDFIQLDDDEFEEF